MPEPAMSLTIAFAGSEEKCAATAPGTLGSSTG